MYICIKSFDQMIDTWEFFLQKNPHRTEKHNFLGFFVLLLLLFSKPFPTGIELLDFRDLSAQLCLPHAQESVEQPSVGT